MSRDVDWTLDSTAGDGPPEPAPQWWPGGTSEAIVRDCRCDYCTELVDALERWRDGEDGETVDDVAEDGEHRTLASFQDGVVADD